MCKIPSESLIRIQGVGTMACGTAPVVNSIVCALPPPGLRGATHWGRFQRMWPARACNTLEGTSNISLITLRDKVLAPRVGIEPTKNGLKGTEPTAHAPGKGGGRRR